MEKSINQKSASIRVVAMPADTNPSGDIFGGWVLSQMDLAGGVLASQFSKKRMTTVAINSMRFHKPIMVGDLVSFYTEVSSLGKTSITIDIQTYVTRKNVLKTTVVVVVLSLTWHSFSNSLSLLNSTAFVHIHAYI